MKGGTVWQQAALQRTSVKRPYWPNRLKSAHGGCGYERHQEQWMVLGNLSLSSTKPGAALKDVSRSNLSSANM